MKPFFPLLLALFLSGCGQRPEPVTREPMFTDDQRREYSLMQTDATGAWLAAIATETNRADILSRFDEEMNRRVVELLADTDSRGSLIAKLDSLSRGKQRHPYTRAQLGSALKLKEQRAEERERRKLLK